MPKTKKPRTNLRDLALLATWLDGYSTLASITDPSRIIRVVKNNQEDLEIATIWKEVKIDISEIAALPSKSEEISRLSKVLGIMRPALMFLGLIVFTLYIALTDIGVLKSLGSNGVLIFLSGFVGAYFVAFAAYYYLNRKVSRLIDSYYEKHMGEVVKARRHLKAVNQKVIDRLATNIRAQKYDPQKYRFGLSQKDYTNIVIVAEGKKGARRYTAVVKTQRHPEAKSSTGEAD